MRVDEDLRLFGRDQSRATRLFHDLAGRDVEDGWLAMGKGQLQILGDELDVDEPARGKLQVSGIAIALFSGDERAYGVRFLSDFDGVALSRQRLSDCLGEIGPEARVAPDETRAG